MPIDLGNTNQLMLYTIEEFAKLMDIQPTTVRKMCAEGELPAKKLARRWFISNQGLLNYFNSQSENEK